MGYQDSVTRCLASLDQLRAAERDLNAAALSLGKDHENCASDKMAQVLAPLAAKNYETHSLTLERLSDREFEVFALVGNGLSTREIAEHLHLALSTVETYRERVKSKLELASGHALTRAATIWALSRKLNPPDNA
jgi:DNA-binding NarL/FixJ family response regulator